MSLEVNIKKRLGGFTLELEGVTYDKSVRGALAGLTRQLEERRMA